MTKSSRKWPVLLVLALLASGSTFWWYKTSSTEQAAANAVATAEAVTGNLEEVVTAQGKLEPKEYVDVGAQVSGQVKVLAVEIGDTVKSGDLIAEIDPEVYQSRVEADEARLKTLEAQKQQQTAEATSAQLKLKRAQTLIKDNAISKEVLEDAQTAVKVAAAQIASLSAQIEEANSTLEGDKANLSYTKIYSTMDGTVVAQSVRQGQTVNANQTAPTIVQVANLDTMTVRAQVAEADIMKLKEGMEMYFTTLGSDGRRWMGTVRQILPSPEVINDVVLYNVLVDVDNKDRQLMSGMSTQLFFTAGKAESAVLIPVTALTKPVPDQNSDAGEAYEIKVMSGKNVTEKIVHIGLMDRAMAEVRAGLQAGEVVVLPSLAPVTPQARGGGRAGGGPRL